MSFIPLEQEFTVRYDGRKIDVAIKDMERTRKGNERFFNTVDRRLKMTEGIARRVKRAIAGAFSTVAIGLFLRTVGRLNGGLEQTRMTFRVMLGDAKLADRVLKDVFTFGEKTPFEFEEVVATARMLLAMGGDVRNLQQEMKMVGDVASGIKAPITDVAQIFGKIRANQRVTAEEMRQLAERGVPIYEELEKVIGKSGNELRKMVEQGKIGFPVILKVFENMTGEGGRFNNMMGQLSATFLGVVSNLKDMASLTFIDVADGFFGAMKRDATGFLETLEEARESGELASVVATIRAQLVTFYQVIRGGLIFIWENRKAIVAVTKAYIGFRVSLMLFSGGATITEAVIKGLSFGLWGLKNALFLARYAMLSLNTAVAANPLGALLVVLSTVATAMWIFRDSTDDATTAVERHSIALAEAQARVAALNEEERNLERDRIRRELFAVQARARILRAEKRDLEAQAERLKKLSTDRLVTSVSTGVGLGPTTYGSTTGLTASQLADNRRIGAIDELLKSQKSEIIELVAAWEALYDAEQNALELPGKVGPTKREDPFNLVRGFAGFDSASVGIMQDLVKQFEQEIKAVKARESLGELSSFRSQEEQINLSIEYGARIKNVFQDLIESGRISADTMDDLLIATGESFQKTQDVAEGAKENLDEANERAKRLKVSFRDIAESFRAVSRFGRVFSRMPQDLALVIDGLADTLSNLDALERQVKNIEQAGGWSTASGAARAGTIASGIGAVAGVATAIKGVINFLSSDGPSTQQRLGDQMELLREEYTRATDRLVSALDRFGEGQIGSDVASDQVGDAAALIRDVIANINALENIDTELSNADQRALSSQLMSAIQTGLADLEATDLEELQGLVAIFRGLGRDPGALLSGGEVDGTEFSGLQHILGLFGQQGQFAQSVDGVIAHLDLFRRAIDDDAVEGFDFLIGRLLGLGGISDQLRTKLGALLLLDPTTAEGARALAEIIAEIATQGIESSDFRGSLSPNEINNLIGALQGFTGLDSGTEYTRSVQYQRSITEISANELTAIAESGLFLHRIRNETLFQIRDTLLLALAPAAGIGASVPSGFPGAAGGGNNFYFQNNFGSGTLTDLDIAEVLQKTESNLRRVKRGAN